MTIATAPHTADLAANLAADLAAATEHAWSIPLAEVDPSNPEYFRTNTMWPYFERLRKHDPVHLCESERYGRYWAITKYKDIMAVDTNHQVFSSEAELGGIGIRGQSPDFILPMFIAMDPPKHDAQRKVVSPIVSPDNLAKMEGLIRGRIGKVLDGLPRDEEFNWVERVSIELTTQMLATLFDFPWEERHLLTHWSDLVTSESEVVTEDTMAARRAELKECGEYFVNLWNERVAKPPTGDLISMLCHGDSTKDMDFLEYLGNVLLLIVGGNDTTRNSMTGGLLALNENQDQYDKLIANPDLIESMVPEIIRWQTPLAHMRRTAVEDIELGGKQIKKGDKVVMWYVSGNRDTDVIENADQFIIDRARPRQHLSFGFGIHRCVGNRLGEMQLRILWEEILIRFPKIEVVGEPTRVFSSFVKGYERMMVRIPS